MWGSHSGQSFKLKAMMSARMMMNWAFILCLCDQNMPNRSGCILKMEINGKPCMMELDTPADFPIVSNSI